LSTVSGEQSKDRTDREVVTPWLKFLWETYRTVLDILKNNSRLEVMYQTTAREAFQFCSKYARKTEFRRLCELLRNHLQNAAKYSAQMHGINLNDADTLQRHLETRFHQLNVAVELELWQEAFRSTEDIHTLLNLSRRPAKNVVMANYFEKLARIFLVSENFLFHAASWNRYYNLLGHSAMAVASGQTKKDNPTVTDATMTNAASFVLLSALSIPVISTSRSRGALVDVDEAKKNKNARLTNLLGMSSPPTRAALLKDALNKGLLKRARPEIRELYNILEVDFHPLSICRRISPILTQIGSNPDMQKYVMPLQQVILTRLFQQLSQVYDSVEIGFVLNLAQFPEPFQVNRSTIEKFIMNGCKKGDLAIRVDHANGVLTFDSDIFSSAKALHPGAASGSAESEIGSVQRLQSTPAEIVRSQLTRLAKALYVTCQYVDPSFNENREKAKAAALLRAKEGAEAERQSTLARRQIIEKRKQEASSALAQKEKDEAARKLIRAQQAQKAEAQRLAEEQKERERKRIQAEQDKIKREEIERQLEELKTGISGKIDIEIPADITSLDSGRIRALKLSALEKEKNALADQLRITGKRIDHLERAYRREEVKHLPKDYETQMEHDRRAYEIATEGTLRESEEKHKEAVALKHRLTRLVPFYQGYVNQVREQRKTQFDKRKKSAEKELHDKMQARIKEVRERRAREKREQEEKERAQREEEERLAHEAEQKEAEEAARRERMLKEKQEREAERAALAEKARLQQQREDEALARRRQRETEKAAPPARQEPSTSAAGGPPRLNLSGSTPSWRERMAAKEAASKDGAPAASSSGPASESGRDEPSNAAESLAPKRAGGYLPPALRNRQDSRETTGGWRSREGSRDTRGDLPPPRSDRQDRQDRQDRNSSPAPGGPAVGGKYRPGAFRAMRDGGQK
jgi:translation initiation factor 3 subunit A